MFIPEEILSEKTQNRIRYGIQLAARLVGAGTVALFAFFKPLLKTVRGLPGIQAVVDTLMTAVELAKIWRNPKLKTSDKVKASVVPVIIWAAITVALIGSAITEFAAAPPLFMAALGLAAAYSTYVFAKMLHKYFTDPVFRDEKRTQRKLLSSGVKAAAAILTFAAILVFFLVPPLAIYAGATVIGIGVAMVGFKIAKTLYRKLTAEKAGKGQNSNQTTYTRLDEDSDDSDFESNSEKNTVKLQKQSNTPAASDSSGTDIDNAIPLLEIKTGAGNGKPLEEEKASYLKSVVSNGLATLDLSRFEDNSHEGVNKAKLAVYPSLDMQGLSTNLVEASGAKHIAAPVA